jgi:NTP pyrophosphatase (non-canonical NTP hydrolase)
MSTGRTCEACDGRSSRAALYCQWCGRQLREPEDFETVATDGGGHRPWRYADTLREGIELLRDKAASVDGEPADEWYADQLTTILEKHSATDRWDARLKESDLRKRTTRAWGPDAQKNKAAEECSELAAALNRDLNGQQDREELLEEFIDARVMLWQLTLMFTEEELGAALDAALDDLADRLEVYG